MYTLILGVKTLGLELNYSVRVTLNTALPINLSNNFNLILYRSRYNLKTTDNGNDFLVVFCQNNKQTPDKCPNYPIFQLSQ